MTDMLLCDEYDPYYYDDDGDLMLLCPECPFWDLERGE